jgi:hypothetical protein
MTLILNGTDNSATTPAVTGTDTDTGVYYPAANQVAIATSGTQAMLANASQGVQFANAIGVGATTPTTSGAGITFPATANLSSNANTLDDYEEGTWTPVAYGTSTAGTFTAGASNLGTYTKIGNMVTGRFVMGLTSKGSSTGDARILGLPFTLGSALGVAVTELAFTFTLSPPTNGWPQDGTTSINLWAMGATGITYTTDTSFGNSTRLDMWFQYFLV